MIKLNRNETLVIMALPIESQGLFEGAGVKVQYSGIGKVNATFKLMEVASKFPYKYVLNLGTAGSHTLAAGQIIECVGFVERDMDLSSVGFPVGQIPGDAHSGLLANPAITPYRQGICGTGDTIQTGPPKLDCDLFDMEAYALAKVCRRLNMNFHSYKFITDSSDANTRKDWKNNLKIAAENLFRVYQEVTE